MDGFQHKFLDFGPNLLKNGACSAPQRLLIGKRAALRTQAEASGLERPVELSLPRPRRLAGTERDGAEVAAELSQLKELRG